MADPEERPELKHIVEALVFASQKPITAKELAAAIRGAANAAKEDPEVGRFAKVTENEIIDCVDSLMADYSELKRSFEIRETASGWQLVTSAAFGPWLRQLFPESRPARMSAPALETLAIIAYRQPVTRSGIEAVRGVAVDGVMATLLDRGLVKIAGRADVPGRPLLYETTTHFMEHFGLRDLSELPNADELRRAAAALAAQNEPAPAPESVPQPAHDELPLEEAPTPDTSGDDTGKTDLTGDASAENVDASKPEPETHPTT